MSFDAPHVLVTGGLGFIGSRVAERLSRRGVRTTVIDNLWSNGMALSAEDRAELDRRRVRLVNVSTPDQRAATIHEIDLVNTAVLGEVLAEAQPTHVVHLAGLSRADLAFNNSALAFTSNLLPTQHLLDVLSRCASVRRVLYTSSSMAYGHFEATSAVETQPSRPIEPYGTSKLAGEVLVQGWGRRLGIESVIVRPSAVYGVRDLNPRVPQAFVSAALAGRPMTLHQRGQQRLDFTYVDDVAQGIELALFTLEAAGEVFNITYGEARTVAELAHIIRAYVPSARIEERDDSITRPRRGTLDISKARQVLGYAPTVSLEEGIRRLLESHGVPVPAEAISRVHICK